MDNKVRIIAIIVASLGVVISAFMIFKTYNEYKKGEEEYSALESYVSESSVSDTSEEQETKKEPEEEEKILKRNYNRSDFPDMEIDYAGLKMENKDYIGWIYMGAAGINYPVVQGADNEYYLHNTFKKEPNFAGCIFIDCGDKADFSMYNTFVYGHAMKNGSMFGDLRKIRKDAGLVKNDPYIYMFLKDGIYRYQIYAYYIDKKDSEMYNSAGTVKEYRQYIRNALDKSMVSCDARPSEEDNSITLVTCQGAGSQKQRFFVHGIFVDRFLYENGTPSD